MAGSISHDRQHLILSEKTRQKKLGIVTAGWNSDVTDTLHQGCRKIFDEFGFPEKQIAEKKVPGSFELPLGAQLMAELGNVQAVVCIGCIIKGETPHFHYIAETVTQKIGDLNIHYAIPFIYGVLTVENETQAKARAGGDHGNKGEEAALAALEMLEFRHSFNQGKQQAGFQKS